MLRSEFSYVCRLCVQRLGKENNSIFQSDYYSEGVPLKDRIKYCSLVEVYENDGFPQQICNTCLTKLNQSFAFYNQCVLADLALKHLANESTFSLYDVPNIAEIEYKPQVFKSCNNFLEAMNKILNCSIREPINSLENTNGKFRSNLVKNEVEARNETSSNDSKKESEENDFQEVKKYKNKYFKDNKLENYNSVVSLESRLFKFQKWSTGDERKFFKNEIENFTIEPDIYEVNRIINEKPQSDPIEGNKKFKKKVIKKITKLKPLGIKRGKIKKVERLKEKPTSYTCDYCQKIYPSEGGWRYHIHTMHNENYQPFICDLCGQSFKVKKNLEGHKNSIHFHLKLHLCDLCGRGFASKYALKVHKIWHNDEKNYGCDICGTKFRTRGKLNTHKTIHGGPKKFMCHICSRNFRWKKDFEVHMRTHTGEKPFKCSHCGKAFASLTNMRKHERNHSEKGSTKGSLPVTNRKPANEDGLLDFDYLTVSRLPSI